jgi:hypothetical protein
MCRELSIGRQWDLIARGLVDGTNCEALPVKTLLEWTGLHTADYWSHP